MKPYRVILRGAVLGCHVELFDWPDNAYARYDYIAMGDGWSWSGSAKTLTEATWRLLRVINRALPYMADAA